jgi:DegV family protein with EDD domain
VPLGLHSVPVAVVTDSTAYLPEGAAAEFGVRVIPLHVNVGGTSYLDGVDLGPAELASAMQANVPVSTSRATPAEIGAVYRQALEAGADGVLGVHLSRQLSATWEAARLAAEELGGARVVRTVDSGSAAMGLGFAVLAAARAAAAGEPLGTVERVAVAVAARTRTFFSVPTLEYLRRGGRIGAATALVGTALAIKPVLHVADGRIVPLEKLRTSSRALARLVELAAQAADDEPASVAVHHLAVPERAAELASRLRQRLPQLNGCVMCELGAVLGAHTGPGVLGVVVSPEG